MKSTSADSYLTLSLGAPSYFHVLARYLIEPCQQLIIINNDAILKPARAQETKMNIIVFLN